MNESKFTELVNSYFDREISEIELNCLRQELAVNPERLREFKVRYRLHKATRVALSASHRVSEESELTVQKTNLSSFSTWLFGMGLATCVAFSFIFSTSIFRESVGDLQSFSGNSLNEPDLGRYAESRAVHEKSRGSLASQLRLMGLTPDIAPAKPQLSEVDMESLRQLEMRRQRAIDDVNQYKTYSALSSLLPDKSLNHLSLETDKPSFPVGFNSSLASF